MKTIIKIFLLLLVTNLYSNELEKISLQLQWKHQFEFAGFYAAKEKGYYEEVGLDVEFIEFDKNISITDEVLNGNANYGLTYSSIIAEYLNGKPLILIANFFKQSPLVLVAQDDIRSPADLRGKRIMGVSNSIDNITLLTMLEKFDIHTQDIINIPTNFSIDDFLNKKIDAMSVFTTNELYYLNKAGAKYNLFDPVVYGSKYYDVNLFTTKNELLNHPDRIKKFRDASIKGWEYALKYKEQIIDIIYTKYNTQNKSIEALKFEANQIEYIMLPNVYKIGSIDIGRVSIIADSFIQAGFVKNKKDKNLKDFVYDYTTASKYSEKKEDENNKSNKFILTSIEEHYLAEKKTLKLCVNPNWMPFETINGGELEGISKHFIKLTEEFINTPIELVQTTNYLESLNYIKDKKCDMLSLVSRSTNNASSLNITSPYLEIPIVIATLFDKHTILDITTLKNQKIAVVGNCNLLNVIKKSYPNINIVIVESIEDGLKAVQDDEIFGLAGTSIAIGHYFQNGDFNDLKISAYFDNKLSLGFGVKADNYQLYHILQKVSQSFSKEQKHDGLHNLLSVKYKKHFDYELFWKFFTVILLIIIFLMYKHQNTRKSNQELQKSIDEELQKSRDKDKMIFHQNKLASMGEVIENIAHQWRQPLSQINSAVLIVDDILYEKNFKDIVLEEKLLEIESLTKYMSKTIDDFKDYFDKNKKKESFLIDELMEKSLYIVKSSLNSSDIEVVTEYEDKYKFFGFPNELNQVLVVILNNAKDMMLLRNIFKPKISISVKKIDDNFHISICDNAGGIKEKYLEKIFEPYFTTKHKSQGTGLGLYISKMIIEDSLKGKLIVNNITGGACFKIILKVNHE